MDLKGSEEIKVPMAIAWLLISSIRHGQMERLIKGFRMEDDLHEVDRGDVGIVAECKIVKRGGPEGRLEMVDVIRVGFLWQPDVNFVGFNPKR